MEDADYARNTKDYSRAIKSYEIALSKMSETLVRSLTKYDSVMLYCAVILAVQVIFQCICFNLFSQKKILVLSCFFLNIDLKNHSIYFL